MCHIVVGLNWIGKCVAEEGGVLYWRESDRSDDGCMSKRSVMKCRVILLYEINVREMSDEMWRRDRIFDQCVLGWKNGRINK